MLRSGRTWPKRNNLTATRSAKTNKACVYGRCILIFSIPVDVPQEKTQREVEVGDCAYWPDGNCFCIFFGRTPASSGNKPVAASAVNVFGRIDGDAKVFSRVKDGERIQVEKA
ncbi:MAG: hypothetical protein NTX81_04415 [Candidatus Bathyarchaeota archaeon]|nr:hypothetical protein [Candidatus Bathyarchaeota archaeon]